jgi:hypothetical protein
MTLKPGAIDTICAVTRRVKWKGPLHFAMKGNAMLIEEASPLAVIRQQEIELTEYLAAAKKAAGVELLEERQCAVESRRQAEREGDEQAGSDYRRQLAGVDVEAAHMLADGERAAARATEHGRSVMDVAVERILKLVLPEVQSCCSR